MPSQPGRRSKSLDSRSASMCQVDTLIEASASHSCTVLIQGESGTGKELIAQKIHRASNRAHGPFIAVDCAALCDSLFESQLFGHTQGAFTGADHDTIGFFRAADGGTLFLDEIGELSPRHQAKLLRCLQEGIVVPVGRVKPIPVDVRIIAASLRSLKAMVQSEGFREDLYFRLAVVCIEVPPLRLRREDILPLAYHFLDAHAEFYSEVKKQLTSAAEHVIRTFPWPGNVRQLTNAMEYAFVTAGGVHIDVGDLPADISSEATPPLSNPGRTLADVERDAILHALYEADFVKSRAAAQLGIEPRRLNRLMSRLGIDLVAERSD